MTNDTQPSILLVEDHPVLAQALAEFLESHGFDVTIVGNGRQALRALTKSSYDFLVTDIVMPVMDGLQLLKWMEDELSDIKIIVTTSVLYEDHQVPNANNILLTLEKPFVPEQLSLLIETLKTNLPGIRSLDGF